MAPHHRSESERPPTGRRADSAEDGEGTADRAITSVRHGIDQVADKVKALLRSDR